MHYFAYGSNMATVRLRCRVPSARRVVVATLRGYSLRFHKSSKDRSGKCDAYFTGSSQDYVVGVVFEIDASERALLDRAEGAGRGYEPQEVKAEADGGFSEAFCYVASRSAIDATLSPYDWYKDWVLIGAREHRLPLDYVARIEGVVGVPDPDSRRAAAERAGQRGSGVLPNS